MSTNTNFATFNPLSNQEGNGAIGSASDDLSNGNTKFNVTNGSSGMCVTIATPPSGGKWYCEFYLAGSVGNYAYVGYYPAAETPEVKKQWSPSGNTTWVDTGIVSVHSMGRYFYTENQYTDSGATSFTAGDIISIALDLDNGATYFAKNGTYMNSGNPASGASKTGEAPTEGAHGKEYLLSVGSAGSSGHNWTINAGQDSSFGGQKTSGSASAADANGFGDFYYSPPSGYLALCSANIPTSSDLDPAGDDGATNNPTKNFGVVTYTGNASTNNITGLGFQPDLVWIKIRNTASNAVMIDSSRGTNKMLHPNNTNTEATTANLTSFDSDGFSLDDTSDYLANYNGNTNTYVAWCWKCNGGTTSTNTDGALTSTVQVNQAAGFSISLYSSNGTGQSFGHGLGAAPDFFMIKKRDTQTRNWMGWHTGLDTASTGYIRWNLTNSQGNDTLWNNTAPSATVINVQKDTTEVNNPSGATYVCYAWRGIEGYSKFGKFEGNGAADGPFVFTGFKPRLVFFKNIDATENWQVRDTARHNNTGSQTRLYWNSDAQEGTASTASPIDFLANGFKIRGDNSEINSNTIIYGAWGDVPFEFSNTHDNG